MKTDPLRIGNLTLDAALESDEAIGLIKAEDLADPYADQTLAALGHLGSYSHVALLTYPGTPEQPVPDRLLLPLNPTGYGPACFLRATGYGGYRLGRPRALNDRTTSAIVAAATDLLGWPRLAPPKPAAATRKKKKEFKPDDRGRRDLPIYLTILTEAGEPVPTEEEIAATPLCELLRTLYARVIEKSPYRLIEMIASGRNGPLAKHVRSPQFRDRFPSTKIRWSGGKMLPPEDGSDSSAYRNLVADVYAYLVKGRDGEANWLKLHDPAIGGIVGWINDKVRVVALRKINDPKDGARIYTPDHEAYDANPAAADLTPDTALAFGPVTFDATYSNQDGAIARIRNYLGRLHEFPMRERRQILDALGTLVEEYYRFDDQTKAELGAELAAARARHLRVEAVAEGSAHLGPRLSPQARENLRAAKAKLALNRPKFAAHDFSNDAVDPYAAPVPEAVMP